MIHDLPSGKRIFDLARTALEIERRAHSACSLSYELYVSMLCQEADAVLKKLPESERRIFIHALGGDYVKPEERRSDWQSEWEIRQELAREMYGTNEYEDCEDYEEVYSSSDRKKTSDWAVQLGAPTQHQRKKTTALRQGELASRRQVSSAKLGGCKSSMSLSTALLSDRPQWSSGCQTKQCDFNTSAGSICPFLNCSSDA